MPFASLPQINEELDRQEKTGVLWKINYNQWSTPTVYVKKKSKEIRVCADFLTELNATLKDYHYSLPSTEKIFVKLNGGNVFEKSTSVTRILKYQWRDESRPGHFSDLDQ